MKRLALSLLIFFAYGCENPTSTLPESGINTLVRSAAARAAAGLDTLHVDATLQSTAGKSYRTTNWISNSVISTAIFTSNSERVPVSSVSINGHDLLPLDHGRYESMDPSHYNTDRRMTFHVTGYDGGIIADTSDNVKELAITSHIVGDSVSKSDGFTVTYSGADGGDLTVYLSFNYSLTYAWGDTVLANDPTTGGYLTKTILDGGSVTFTKDELKGFTPGTYIHLSLEHWVYHVTESSTDKRVGIFRSNGFDIPLFLKP